MRQLRCMSDLPTEVPGVVGAESYTRDARSQIGSDMKQKGRDRNAIRAHRRLATRHDPSLPRGRSAAAVFGGPSRRGGRARALAADAGAEFVVVAGDVFEDNQLAPQVISQSLEAMRAIGIPVYLLPGNHDPLDASSVYTSALFTAECPANVTVLDRPGIHEVRPGLQIVAAPWRSKAPTTDLVAEVLGTRGAAGRRGHPGARCPRRRRRARSRPDQAVADPAGRPGGRAGPRRGALCGAGRQAFGHRRGQQRAGLVLRLAGGHQLRRRRAGSRPRAGGRHRRDRSPAPGQRRRPAGWPLAVCHPAPAGRQQPRHRRPRREPGSDARQGPNCRCGWR